MSALLRADLLKIAAYLAPGADVDSVLEAAEADRLAKLVRESAAGGVAEAVVIAAQAYYTGYCQDEADDADGWDEGTSVCSREQAVCAAELRDALKSFAAMAALAAQTKQG
jgi:hypothetical protein